jgi:N6-adenosine-specific RNA methylase IME4
MFKTILIDPPWETPGGGKSKRGSDRHYNLVKTKDLPDLIMNSGVWVIHEDAHLWLWTVNSKLEDALWLMKELGFRYVTNAVWVKIRNEKLQFGLGRYMRGSHELLLFGVKGKAHLPEVAPLSVFGDLSVLVAERSQHSSKPIDQYDLIEQISAEPRLEIFARNKRCGWASWGDQI